MTLSFDNHYAHISQGVRNYFHLNTFSASGPIHPGKFTEDTLFYETPLDNISYLHLELPASAFGGTGMLRLQIPKSMIMP
jgi:hypothetical protein